ncbi:Hypothetical protein NTJ_13659 [Nesidiocoris tenuis]|uniref:Ashwin n=1 Tax=Nesidiocoris tenuis TaxID=355587 RepID=A0ABN7B8X2_9HEMI|nr:Hypothetical protein NTJ_13659 [Nesidiocoris tenuis]
MSDDEIPVFRLLQPDIMTNDELVSVLKRYKLSTNLSSTSRDELIEIYKRIALPLPQRTNGTTWRERLLAKKRNRKRISLDTKETAGSMNANQSSSTNNGNTRPVLSARRDRLKPPISAASDRKVVRLSTSSNNDSPSSCKTADVSTEEENGSVTPQTGKHKRIRIDFSDSAEKSTPVPKVVRRLSEEKVSNQPISKHRRIVI